MLQKNGQYRSKIGLWNWINLRFYVVILNKIYWNTKIRTYTKKWLILIYGFYSSIGRVSTKINSITNISDLWDESFARNIYSSFFTISIIYNISTVSKFYYISIVSKLNSVSSISKFYSVSFVSKLFNIFFFRKI